MLFHFSFFSFFHRFHFFIFSFFFYIFTILFIFRFFFFSFLHFSHFPFFFCFMFHFFNFAEIHVFGTSIFWRRLVMFLSFASVTPELFSSWVHTCVVFGQHSMNCVSLSDTARSCAGVAQCSVSWAGVVQHIRCLFVFLSLGQFILFTRLCVPDLRHCMQHGSRKPHVSISSRWRSLCLTMKHDVGEPSEADGGSVGYGTTRSTVCWECSADGWEHSQLVLRDLLERRVLSAREKLVNLRRLVEKVAWAVKLSAWFCTCEVSSSGVVWERSNKWWLGCCETWQQRRDPAIADKVTMKERKRRLSIHLYCAIALTCRRRVSLAVRRVFSFGFEAWKKLCKEFEPWVSSRF